jgi:bacterioferritin-associated ferredoxin
MLDSASADPCAGMYCVCSDASFDEILSLQRQNPLPFHEAIDRYTNCFSGCGSCVEALREVMTHAGLLPSARPSPSK